MIYSAPADSSGLGESHFDSNFSLLRVELLDNKATFNPSRPRVLVEAKYHPALPAIHLVINLGNKDGGNEEIHNYEFGEDHNYALTTVVSYLEKLAK